MILSVDRDVETGHTVPAALVAAAVFGAIHAGFSIFWSMGGTWLVWSLGGRLQASFHGWEWVLAPIGLVKLTAAVAPILLAYTGWPARSLTHAACWLGALVLIIWGGLNTVVGNLVLAAVIRPDSGYDRPGMIGHAFLWDPLFLCWGAALAVGLFASRLRRPERTSTPVR
jgi:hypothetical protein